MEKTVRIVDTTEVENLAQTSPFEEEYHWKADLITLLIHLRSELRRPVAADEEKGLYRPTQRFCDLLRKYGYAGLMYPSAMGKGFNLVLFDPSVAVPTEVCHVRVAGVAYRIRPLLAGEPLFDEQPYDDLLL